MSSATIVIFLVGIICWLIGLGIGCTIKIRDSKKIDGILGIDKRGEEKDYYDFVILTPINELDQKRYLKVEVKIKE